MNDCTPCEQNCLATCPGPAPAPAQCATCPSQTTEALADVIARFWREADRGVCDTGRYHMPYYVWGSGPPLVFIHGVADSSFSFVQLNCRLSASFRCIAYDLPNGHGDRARLWRYRHADLVADLWALLDHLDVKRAYVLGASFGSSVALKALAERPERLPRAVLQGAIAYRPLRRAERWLSWLSRFLPGPTARIPKREKILELVHGKYFARQPAEVWRAFVEWTARARLAALGHQTQWLHRLDLRAVLPVLRQPILLVHGDHDTVVPIAHAELLRSALPAAGLLLLENCGHLPCWTHPDELATVMRQFLTPPARSGQSPALLPACSHLFPLQP
jgi:pimeloyl-ACP methyl ester carboxylesterase